MSSVARAACPTRWGRGGAALAAAAVGLSAPLARAQVPPPPKAAAPPPASVVAPRLASPSAVDYPSGAAGDAVVVLELTVNADGSVRSALPLEGREPFAAAAVGASRTWRFEPATRDGRPVAARIRFQVSFTAPAPVEEPAAPAAPPATDPAPATAPGAAPRPAPPPPQALVVEVRGEKLAPGVTSFARAEVRQLPGAFGDPFRAIEVLPGVTPIVSGLPFFYVRGAPPGNVGYFLDGVRVPYLFHVGVGPSVIHPAMVERVDLYPGGYPARFGRFAGGIVSGEATEPRTEPHGEGNIRLFDAGAVVEAGFADGRATALVGGRYSYTAALLSLIAPTNDLAYRDYQLRVTYDPTPRDRLTLFSFGSYDLLGQTQNGIESIVFGSEFYRLDLRYDHTFGPSSAIRTAVTLGYDQTRVGDQRNARDRMLGVRTELRHPLGEHVLLRAGADGVVDALTADQARYGDPDSPDTQAFNRTFPPRSDLAMGVWADLVVDVTPAIEVTPGVRVDYFGSGGATALACDPRLAARFKVADRVRIVHAYGLAHQPPSFVVPIPGLVPGKLQGGLQTSFQTSAGVEVDLPDATTATATFFHNAFFNMSDTLGISGNTDVIDNVADRRAAGSAVGFELFVRRRLTRRLGGFVSYTLSRSTRTLGQLTFPSAFDRTHVANAAVALDLGRNWRAGTRVVFYTGTPVLVASRGLLTSPPAQSPDRNPAFYRIDVRLEKRWALRPGRWISFVMEVMNVTLSKETFNTQTIGPITIPSLGVEAGF